MAHRQQAVDEAEAFILSTPGATYRDVAKRFAIPLHAIRGRIQSRYGSLAEGRAIHAKATPSAPVKQRKCLCCSTPIAGDNRRMCEPCGRRISNSHDGWV